MSTIKTSVSIVHFGSGLRTSSSVQRTAYESTFSADSISVGTTPETVALGDITTPRTVLLRNSSGNDLLVGFSNSVFPMRLSATESMLLRLDVEGLVEKSTVTTVADVAGSLDGDYFVVTGLSGSWGIWYDVDNNGTPAPAHGATSAVEVTGVVTGATAAAVAAATYASLTASTAFMLDFSVSYTAATSVIVITDRHTGTRTSVSAGTSGFTVAETQSGAASPSIYLKSTGTTNTVVAVAPN